MYSKNSQTTNLEFPSDKSMGTLKAKVAPLTSSPIKISPLANPKQVKLDCEICSKPAHFTCPDCRLTYYCNEDHLSLDREAIHAKICHILKQLRTPGTLFGSEEERNSKERALLELRKTLLNITRTDSQKLLFEGQFAHAIPAALQALRCTVAISGTQSLELVPCYLLLGEASIGLKEYEQAESYLASAEWALLKTPMPEMQAKLFHHFGLLYFSKHHYPQALQSLSKSIMIASQLYGAFDIRVSGTFFQLGCTFQAQQELRKATSAFLHVIEIWLKYYQEKGSKNELDAAQAAEVQVMLHRMAEFFKDHSAWLMRVKTVHALFLKVMGQEREAYPMFETARKLAMMQQSDGFYDWTNVFPWVATFFNLLHHENEERNLSLEERTLTKEYFKHEPQVIPAIGEEK